MDICVILSYCIVAIGYSVMALFVISLLAFLPVGIVIYLETDFTGSRGVAITFMAIGSVIWGVICLSIFYLAEEVVRAYKDEKRQEKRTLEQAKLRAEKEAHDTKMKEQLEDV